MSVSIFSVVSPPYEDFLYVSYGVSPAGVVEAFVWPAERKFGRSMSVPITLAYPAADHDRAIKEIEELSGLIISTRRLLGLVTPVREAQKL